MPARGFTALRQPAQVMSKRVTAHHRCREKVTQLARRGCRLVALASVVLGGTGGTAMARLFVQILTPLSTNPHECCARRGQRRPTATSPDPVSPTLDHHQRVA